MTGLGSLFVTKLALIESFRIEIEMLLKLFTQSLQCNIMLSFYAPLEIRRIFSRMRSTISMLGLIYRGLIFGNSIFLNS